jgi:hypothetical protein
MTDQDHTDHAARAAAARANAGKVKPRGRRVDYGAICGADTAKGTPCKRTPGEGTEHAGVGPCKTHDKGWGPMRADTKVEKYARPLLAKLTGYDVDVNPMDALLMAVRITAAEVAYFSERIGQLEEHQLSQRTTIKRSTVTDKGGGKVEKSIVQVEGTEELTIWMKARKQSIRDMAHFSKMAMDAGVEERMVRVAESVGEALAAAVRGILDDLGLSNEQREQAPALVRKHLRLIGTGGTR